MFNHFLYTLNTCRSLLLQLFFLTIFKIQRRPICCGPNSTTQIKLCWPVVFIVLLFFFFLYFVFVWQYVTTVALVCRPERLQMTPPYHFLLSCPRRFQDHDVFTAERHVARVYCQSSPCRQHVCVLMDRLGSM